MSEPDIVENEGLCMVIITCSSHPRTFWERLGDLGHVELLYGILA